MTKRIEEHPTHPISINFTQTVHRLVDRLAAQDRMNRSAFVRKLIQEEAKRRGMAER